MFSHITIGTNDFAPAFTFHERIMTALGHRLRFYEPEVPWAAWETGKTPRPLFVLCSPFDGADASAGNGSMTALLATNRSLVSECYELALAAGGRSEGEPALRPQYHQHYFGAYYRDLDGNKFCVVCHEP